MYYCVLNIYNRLHERAVIEADNYELSAPMEIGGISGMVIDGVPHLHCTFSDHDRAWAEHLEEGCRILYVGEISMIGLLDLDITRIPNEFGVKLPSV